MQTPLEPGIIVNPSFSFSLLCKSSFSLIDLKVKLAINPGNEVTNGKRS